MGDIKKLWDDRIKIWGFALAIAGAIWIILDQVVPDEYSMIKGHLLILIFVSTLLIVALFIISKINQGSEDTETPKIVEYSKTDYMDSGVFTAMPSRLLNHNLRYGLIIEEIGGFEKIIGSAKYVMTQSNGLIQLMVVSRNPKTEDVWASLDGGDKDKMRRVRVKMGMPTDE